MHGHLNAKLLQHLCEDAKPLARSEVFTANFDITCGAYLQYKWQVPC